MKILILSSYLPFPLYSGGHIRLYNIIKELSKKHSITLVCEDRFYQTEEDRKELEKFCKKVITVTKKKQWTVRNILKACFSLYPFLLVGHTNQLFKKTIKEVVSEEKFDFCHVETFYIMQNLPRLNIPLVLAEHNIEYLVYKRFIETKPFFLRLFLYLDILKIKLWEEYYWGKVKKLIAVSEEEKKLMGEKDIEVVPNGVDVKQYQISKIKNQKSSREKRILFIGDFRWLQNRDACEWMIKEIWPHIKSKVGKLWIVGRKIPDSIKNLTNDDDIIFDENAPSETSEIYSNADILLAPIRVGGGTSFKILEAMASGLPVVTTPLGIEGIKAVNGKDVLIGENADELGHLTVNVLQDEKLYNKLGIGARKLIEENYDWKIIVKKLEEVYKDLIR